MKRIMAAGTVVLALATTALVGPATPASADSYNGCAWPRVCFYQTQSQWLAQTPNAAYKDVTSHFQNLSAAARGSDYVLNTRNNDIAWINAYNELDGLTYLYCIPPNGAWIFSAVEEVRQIRIDDAANCY